MDYQALTFANLHLHSNRSDGTYSPKELLDYAIEKGLAAMALTDNSVPIDYEPLKKLSRLAIIMGTEGDGLAHEVIGAADYVVRIPMAHGVDSLNVAAAAAVAFWELRMHKE